MDPNKPSSSGSGRKMRFVPKAPKRKSQTRTAAQRTEAAAEDNVQAQRLLRRLHENLQRTGRKVERTSSVQVAYGPGASPSTSDIYGDSTNDKNVESRMLSLMKAQRNVTCVAKDEPYERDERLMDIDGASGSENEGTYTEPWNHENPHVPLRIPWMRPNSSAPEIMGKDESEDNEKTMKYDESTMNAASELGLLDSDESKTRKFFFFQFPPTMPLIKRLATAEGKERENTNSFDPKGKGKEKLDDSKSSHLKGKVGGGDTKSFDSESPESSKYSNVLGASTRCCRFEELPAGRVGKMIVYMSGAIKLRLGDTLFDVSPGSASDFHQDAVAMNTETRNCYVTGRIDKQAVVSLDINSILGKDH
ncbi:hypothetical protein AKJ16_DCAP11188 [Drosera capensis]